MPRWAGLKRLVAFGGSRGPNRPPAANFPLHLPADLCYNRGLAGIVPAGRPRRFRA